MTLTLFISFYSISDAAPSEFKEVRVRRRNGDDVGGMTGGGKKEGRQQDGPVVSF